MGSPVTLSGFNQIDFNQILNAIMQQERIPVVRMEASGRRSKAQKSAYATLASKLAASSPRAPTCVPPAPSRADQHRCRIRPPDGQREQHGSAPAPYEVVVEQLAKARSRHPRRSTPILIRRCGKRRSVTIGGVAVTIGGT